MVNGAEYFSNVFERCGKSCVARIASTFGVRLFCGIEQSKPPAINNLVLFAQAHKVNIFHWKENSMPMIKIDGKDYELDNFSEEAKGQLASLQFVDAELLRLVAQTAVLQTARMAYSKALQQALPALSGETIKFN